MERGILIGQLRHALCLAEDPEENILEFELFATDFCIELDVECGIVKKLLLKEAIDIIGRGGELVHYWDTGASKIIYDREYEIDRRSYHALLGRGYKPRVINYRIGGK